MVDWVNCNPFPKILEIGQKLQRHESNGDRNKALSTEEYLNKISPYLKDITNNLKTYETWKIQLMVVNNFYFSIDNNEERVMHSNSNSIEIMISDKADEVIKKLFDSLKNRYQNNLEPMKGTEFVSDYVQLLYYKCHKINPNHGRSYIDCPDSIKNKKATISKKIPSVKKITNVFNTV